MKKTTTMQEMMKKLTNMEHQRLQAEKEAKEKVRTMEFDVIRACEELQEVQRAHKHELNVLHAQYEKKLRDTAHDCRKKVHGAQEALARAGALADNAEDRRKQSEAHVVHLTAKVAELQNRLKERKESGEKDIEDLNDVMGERLQRVALEAEERVLAMQRHKDMVERTAEDAIETVGEELHGQISRAQLRAESRVRFRELCELSRAACNYAIPREAYYDLKGEVLDFWRAQAWDPRPVTAPAGFAGDPRRLPPLEGLEGTQRPKTSPAPCW